MSLGDSWKLGVWHPFPNPHFEQRDRIASSLGALFSSGNIVQLKSTEANFQYHVRVGDYVRIGASTGSTCEGSVQYFKVIGIDAGNRRLTLDQNIASGTFFNLGDPIMAWASAVPAGWLKTSTSYWETLGIQNVGLLSPYPFGTNAWRLSAPSATQNVGSIAASTIEYLLSGVVYYGAAIYKASSIVSVEFAWYDNAGYKMLSLYPTTQSVWTEVAGVSAAATIDYWYSYPQVKILRVAGDTSSNLYVKTMILMHATGTSQQAFGVYILSSKPDSIDQYKIGMDVKDTKTIEGSKIVVRRRVTNSLKTSISAAFSKILPAEFDDLTALLEWQSKGAMICLNPYLTSVPRWMIGVAEIRNVSRDTETGRMSFTFMFEEKV